MTEDFLGIHINTDFLSYTYKHMTLKTKRCIPLLHPMPQKCITKNFDNNALYALSDLDPKKA